MVGGVQCSTDLLTSEALRPAWWAGAVTAVRPLPIRVRASTEGEEASRSPGELAGEGGQFGKEGVGRDGRRKDTPGRGHSWSQGHVGQFWRGVASWQHRGLCVGVGWRGAVGDEAEGQEELLGHTKEKASAHQGHKNPVSSGHQIEAEWKAWGALGGSSVGDPDAKAQPV